MLHEDILYISYHKLNYWLVICIAKNFIWTTLKVIFSIFWFFCTLRFQIFKYCPIITNHTSMESYLFSFQMMHTSQFHKIDPYDWFCAPGSQTFYAGFCWVYTVLTSKCLQHHFKRFESWPLAWPHLLQTVSIHLISADVDEALHSSLKRRSDQNTSALRIHTHEAWRTQERVLYMR